MTRPSPLRRLTIAAVLAGALGGLGACHHAAPEPAGGPEARPCDKTVDACPRTPINGQPNGTPTTTPPTGDPSTKSPANPPSPPPGQGVPPGADGLRA